MCHSGTGSCQGVRDPALAEMEESVSQLLEDWSGGNREAAARLIPKVYAELHRIAEGCFRRERRDHTLQATALVHEAYVRLVEDGAVQWQNRAHFFGMAACVMRRVLVSHARERARDKRGGAWQKVTLAEAADLGDDKAPDILALDDALASLRRIDRQKASVVELRYFGGLTIEEIADCLGVAPITVSRQWRRAKAWLYLELAADREVLRED